MQIDYIPKDHAEKLISTIIELRPSMKIRIQAEDTALFMLGLSKSILCSVVIDENEDSILSLIDEVYQMEVDAFNFDEKRKRTGQYRICKIPADLRTKILKVCNHFRVSWCLVGKRQI